MHVFLKKNTGIALCTLFSATSLFAQQTIKGTISNEKGPIAGVTVTVIGSNRAAQTSHDGTFSISANQGDKLRISMIGYQSEEITISSNKSLTVSLKETAASLDEVVVTGLGESREKRQLGYAMTQISGDEIRRTNAINPIAALQGMVPGLQVNVGTGGPQSTPRFQIRGAGSLNQYGNTPLVVVDGIIMDEEVVLPNRGGDQDFGNVLKNISPDDIATISVLNGGSVTALYGSRAAGGVILITTKKGYSQKGFGIGFTHTQGFDKPYATADMQDKYGPGSNPNAVYVAGTDGYEQIPTTNYGYSFGPKFDGRMVKDVDGRLVPFQTNNNPLDLFRTGRYNNSNLSLQGGNEQTTFRMSYSNTNSTGVAPNNKLTRNNFNLRATHRMGKSIILDAGATYVNSQSFNPQYGGERWNMGNNVMYGLSYGMPRSYDLNYWKDNYKDAINGGVTQDDPTGKASLLFTLYEQKQQQIEDNFRGTFNARINFTDWLMWENNFTANLFSTNRQMKNRGQEEGFNGGSYNNRSSRVLQTRYRSNLNFTKKTEDFELTLQAGGEVNHSLRNGMYGRTDGMLIADVFRLSNSKLPAIVNEDKPNQSRIVSGFFQTAVTYKNWLTLNLYGRNDWDSSLVYPDGSGNFSYFYPGADLSWVLSDALKLPENIFSFAKLRMSYNKVGRGTSTYRAMTGYYTANTPYGGIPNYGFDSKTLGNRNLKPESSDTYEIGTELKMLKNRLGFDFTYYTKNTIDQITSVPISQESGVTAALVNGGHIRSRGIEARLYGTPVKTQNFSWDVNFNYSRDRNKIISLPFGAGVQELDADDGIRSIAKVGGDYGTLVASYGHARFQARDGAGNPIDHVNNGKPVMATTGNIGYYLRSQNYAQGLEKEVTIGSSLPDFMGSLLNRFNYKSFSFSFMLDAKFGGMVYSPTYNYGMQTGQIASSLYGRQGEAGSVAYKDANGNEAWGIIPDAVFRQGTVVNGNDLSGMSYQETVDKGWRLPISAVNYYNNSYGWGNGIRELSTFKSSWLILRDVSFSYDLPTETASRLKLNNLRLTLTARNLGYLYNTLPDNINPEDNRSSGSINAFLGGGSPMIRNFSFTINTNF